jgi:hypothetical protein
MQNVKLARTVVSRIESSPGNFRMRNWGIPHPVRYTACLAGHTLLESGYAITGRNIFSDPGGIPVANPGIEAVSLLGLTVDECRRGIHWWKCNPFCENMPEDVAFGNFLELIVEEEQRRLVSAS